MPSLIPGYEYDIFISYRQKDNKGDRWVSEFVNQLKGELESTFKEEISVYFDINPHDGLLETHDVDASLEDKLKCLIFIPVVSRTYCDPKSFAWDHEFKAFVNQASHDGFGLKIKLPNGNVANRVLPVRIHDLGAEDVKLCESVIGGFLRGVDFIYKSSGVNRPLRAHEDHPHDNQNKTYYRDQINKVANAIDEIITGLKKAQRKPEEELIVSAPVEKTKAEIRDREPDITNDQKKAKFSHDRQRKRLFILIKKPWYYRIAALLIFLAIVSGAWYIHHKIKIKWALTKALPEIQQFTDEYDFEPAFNLFQKAEKYIPENPKLRKLAEHAVRKVMILTNPPGAEIYIRKYSDTEGKWKKFGRTPLESMEMPNFMFYVIRIEKPGYEDVVAVLPTQRDTLYRTLFKKGSVPQDMVFVEGFKEEMAGGYLKRKNGFFMDRYEVTNKEFKEFIDKGGYRDPRYWTNKFIKDGKMLTREEAMAEFTDRSGRPGPATWEAGDYPDGQDDYPVTGISWYEAAAYALFAGKDIPTLVHWGTGAGFYNPAFGFESKILPLSNFKRKGPEAVGKNKGINSFGASDMAGNVREWCWNETQNGHIIRGGGWDDADYMYINWSQVPTFDRSAKNGLRCVKYPDKGKIPENAFQKIEYSGLRDYSKEKPLPEKVFRIFKNQFLYDDKPLDAIIEQRDESPQDWIIEKVTFNAAYENERVVSYLFLPKNSAPLFQTILFFPGGYALWQKDLVNSIFTEWFIDYILKSGRAVMYPVYKGTYERMDEPIVWEGHQYKEWLIKWVKDFSRSIDYLETRSDIDTAKLGFYGQSWGGEIGGIIPAIENRLATTILINGGFNSWSDKNYPEADAINYVPQIRMPVLMLSGKYDMSFPYETTVKPFFNLLGTAAKDKRLVIYETDHYVPKSEMIKEVLNWLDKYFGPVNYLKGK